MSVRPGGGVLGDKCSSEDEDGFGESDSEPRGTGRESLVSAVLGLRNQRSAVSSSPSLSLVPASALSLLSIVSSVSGQVSNSTALDNVNNATLATTTLDDANATSGPLGNTINNYNTVLPPGKYAVLEVAWLSTVLCFGVVALVFCIVVCYRVIAELRLGRGLAIAGGGGSESESTR